MRNLMRRLLARNQVFLIVCTVALAGLEFLFCAIVASVDVEGALSQVAAFAPPLLRAVIEQNALHGSTASVLAFGWNHPVAHALLTAVAVTLSARAIAGEVESGAIELVLAQPLSRARYFGAHLLFGACALAAVLTGGLLATALGQHVYSLHAFGWPRLVALFVNALLLQLAIYGLTLLASAYGREAGRVALVGLFVAVVSYFGNAIAALWSKAEFVRPYSLHGYFDPRQILVDGRLPSSSVVVLGAVATIATAAAFVRFVWRDLP